MGTKKKRETLVQLIRGMKAVIGKYWTPKGAFEVPKGGKDPMRSNPLIVPVQRAVRTIKALPPVERDAAAKELFGFLYGHDAKKNRPNVSAQFLGDVERDLLRSLEETAMSDPALAVSLYNEWGRRVRLDMAYLADRHEDPHRLLRALRDAAGAAGYKEAAVDASGALIDSLGHGNSLHLVDDLTRHAEVVGEAHGGAAKAAFRRGAAKRLQCVGEYVAAARFEAAEVCPKSGHRDLRLAKEPAVALQDEESTGLSISEIRPALTPTELVKLIYPGEEISEKVRKDKIGSIRKSLQRKASRGKVRRGRKRGSFDLEDSLKTCVWENRISPEQAIIAMQDRGGISGKKPALAGLEEISSTKAIVEQDRCLISNFSPKEELK